MTAQDHALPPVPAAGPTPGRPPAGPPSTGRAGWHRRVNALPLAYLAALVVVGVAHPWLPGWRWLAIHLLLLGAVSNAILIWSAHFTTAVLRTRAPQSRRPEAARLAVLNLGVLGVLTGGTAVTAWVAVAGAAGIVAAVAAHLGWLQARLRAALPSRLSITVRYYQAAAVALLLGAPAGAWLLFLGGDWWPRVLLFHAHVNLLGWVTLTVLGTVLTFWPTVLRTKLAPDAISAARLALPLAVSGLAALGAGLLGWWRPLVVLGLTLFAAAVLVTAWPAVRAARGKPPASFSAWSIAAAHGWLLVALGIAAGNLAGRADPAAAAAGFGLVLLPLLVGFVGQVLVGALAYLLPMALGGGPDQVRQHTARLARYGAQRVTMANVALAVFLLPVPPAVRITTSLLILAALLQFLVPAAHLLLTTRRRL